jgi:hypothetical protein
VHYHLTAEKLGAMNLAKSVLNAWHPPQTDIFNSDLPDNSNNVQKWLHPNLQKMGNMIESEFAPSDQFSTLVILTSCA